MCFLFLFIPILACNQLHLNPYSKQCLYLQSISICGLFVCLFLFLHVNCNGTILQAVPRFTTNYRLCSLCLFFLSHVNCNQLRLNPYSKQYLDLPSIFICVQFSLFSLLLLPCNTLYLECTHTTRSNYIHHQFLFVFSLFILLLACNVLFFNPFSKQYLVLPPISNNVLSVYSSSPILQSGPRFTINF